MKNKKITLLIVDDHPTVSFGTKMILEDALEEIATIDIAESGKQALDKVKKINPEIIFLDLNLPDIDGLEVAKQCKDEHPSTHIVIFTGNNFIPILNRLLDIGISGVLSKEATPEQVIRMVHSILDGYTVLPLELFQQLRFRTNRSVASVIVDEEPLTEREEYVLSLVGQGYTNKEIAKELYLSTRSIEYYLTKIYEKLNVKSRAEAVEKFNNLK